MNRAEPDIETLRAELEAAFRNRADLYRLTLEELEIEIGPERAEVLLSRIVERRGGEVAATAFARFGPRDSVAIGEAFLGVSPDGGRMYPVDVTREPDAISFQVRRCPLKDAWVESGLEPERVAQLCRIAGAFDRGLFEATGIRFANRTWQPGDGPGCCWIRLNDAISASD